MDSMQKTSKYYLLTFTSIITSVTPVINNSCLNYKTTSKIIKSVIVNKKCWFFDSGRRVIRRNNKKLYKTTSCMCRPRDKKYIPAALMAKLRSQNVIALSSTLGKRQV